MKTDTWYPRRHMSWQQWELAVQSVTERALTWRKRRRIVKKEKQKKKNPVLDWLDAILSAVVIVLLINQYLLQAYQIPSESMKPSLLISDRIFVNKLVYGPELVPGMLKVTADEVLEVARDLLRPEAWGVGLLGPVDETGDYGLG